MADPALGQPAGCVTSVTADLDGDGRADRFSVYARLDSKDMPQSWQALAFLSRSRAPTADASVPTGQGVSYVYPRAMAAVDADGDGRAEAFVKLSAILYHGGGQKILGMYKVEGTEVVPVSVRGQRRLVFPIGGIGGYGDGAECVERSGAPLFVIRHIQRKPPSTWVWLERQYRWDGAELVLERIRRGTYPGTIYISDEPVHHFYELRCGPLLTS
jgi:hypothetical protein